MTDQAAVADALREAVRCFGPPAAATPALRWGPLFAALDADASAGAGAEDLPGTAHERRTAHPARVGHAAGGPGYVTAIELIYEGYLLHYRQSRVGGPEMAGRETALLAGDCLYARGLRLIAVRGDAQAVGLLARLMAACSYLRSVGAPFAADDALWAYTMGGLAALRHGVAAATAASLFDELDAALTGAVVVDLPALAAAAGRRLGLRDATPLERALANVTGEAAEGVVATEHAVGPMAPAAAGAAALVDAAPAAADPGTGARPWAARAAGSRR